MIRKFQKVLSSNFSLEKTSAIVCIYDSNLHIQYCNEFGFKTLGFTPDKFIGHPLANYHTADDLKAIKDALQQCRTNHIIQLKITWFNAGRARVKTLSQFKKIVLSGKTYFTSIGMPLECENDAVSAKKSPVPQPRQDEFHKKLMHYLIDEEHYLDKDISLTKTATSIRIPQKYLSYIINHRYELNFNDFINYHRLLRLEAIRKLSKEATGNSDVNLRKAGFGSPATFYRAQKKAQHLFEKMGHAKH